MLLDTVSSSRLATSFKALTDDELITRLQSLCVDGHHLTARVVTYLIEVEERRIHLKTACTSMFDFCTRRLNMSAGAAYRRINAARLTKRFPRLINRIDRGEIHLSSLVLLRKLLTEENFDELVSEASGKTKLEVEVLVARYAPKPDVPSTIRKLPTPTAVMAVSPAEADAASPAGIAAPEIPSPTPQPLAFDSNSHPSPSPARTASTPSMPPQTRLAPLSPDRYRMQLTIDGELRAKLERAQDLMRHRNPSGDLATIVEQAIDVLLQKLEKERLGKTARPVKKARPIKDGSVSAEARRQTFARDGEQCGFVDAQGRRCTERGFLELDHIEPEARGGLGTPENLRVMCHAHNLFYAEQAFGKAHIQARQQSGRKTPPHHGPRGPWKRRA